MKRFWTDASAERSADGWLVRLDRRELRTPARRLLLLPSEPLARAIAGEWALAGERVEPRAMKLTGIANAAIDHVLPDAAAFRAPLARYGEADLFYYRSEGPAALVGRQQAEWDPLLDWARSRYRVEFNTASGIVHLPQPAATVDRLARELALLDPFALAAMAPLVTIGGSLVAALALAEAAIPPVAAWQAVSLDESWQLEQWGEDPEALAALGARRADFLAAARFLELARTGAA